MIKLLNAVRVACLVLALAVIFSGILFPYLQWHVHLTTIQRLGIILPLLAIFNVATSQIRKRRLLASQAVGTVSTEAP